MERDKTAYLKLYEEWMQAGRITDSSLPNKGYGGLCNTVIGRGPLKLFHPTLDDYLKLPVSIADSYWAADNAANPLYTFGPTRQNIVLLLAAMNNEL